MRQASQKVAALLEIGRKANGEIPASLISAAYRASRSTSIVLALDSVSPAEVDQVLDPVVAHNGYDVCGVSYVKVSDDAALAGAAAASRVFASSQGFRAKLTARGIPYRDVSEAEFVLAAEGSVGD